MISTQARWRLLLSCSLDATKAVVQSAALSGAYLARRRRFRRAFEVVERERRAEAPARFRDSKARKDALFLEFLVPCGVGAYCELIGEPLTEDVCISITLACGFIFPYDDLVDEHRLSAEHLHVVLHDPAYAPRSAEEHRARWFYRRLMALPAVRDNALFRAALAGQLEAQRTGLARQGVPSAPLDVLRDETHAKAATAVLLGFSLLNPRMSAREQEANADLAMWVQLVDDAMDRRRDLAAGVHTLMSRCLGSSEVHTLLERQWVAAFGKYSALTEYEKRRMEAFLFELRAAAALTTALVSLSDRAGRGVATATASRGR